MCDCVMSLMKTYSKNQDKILLEGDCSSESGYQPKPHDCANYAVFKMA